MLLSLFQCIGLSLARDLVLLAQSGAIETLFGETSLLRYLFLASLTVVGLAAPVSAQTYFSDNFNRANNTSLGSPTVGGAYSETSSGTTGNAQILGNLLDITSGASAVIGNDFASSAFGGGFTNLGVQGVVEWTFNMRYNRTTAPSGGFSSGYAMALVLTATNTNLDDVTNSGYAVVYGLSGNNQIQLVRYSGGLSADANMTNIINTGNNPLGTVNDFASIRVRFNNATDTWQLFLRDDGASGFADPATGVNTQIGANTIDSFNINSGSRIGFYWSHGNANNQSAQFDNVTFAAIPEPTTWALIGLATVGLGGGVWRLRRKKAAILNSEVEINEAAE